MKKKKILHLSHHHGCFRDQSYVLEKLGFEVTNYKFIENLFQITKEISDEFWFRNKNIINSYDFVLTSDTAALSRIFLEHFEEFKPKLVIWICNRFDVFMDNDPEFYKLFKHYSNHPNVKIVASTFFEKMWCLINGIDISYNEVINPLGKHSSNQQKIPHSQWYTENYGNSNPLDADVFVTAYTNDKHFMSLGNTLQSMGVSVYTGTFAHIEQLKKYKAVCTLPDTFCKWFSFEMIQNNIPAILPSTSFLHYLCKQPNYLFNVNGYGGAELMTEDLLSLSEWYKPEFISCRYYFNSFEEIPEIVFSIDKNKVDFSKHAAMHENEVLIKWRKLYDSF